MDDRQQEQLNLLCTLGFITDGPVSVDEPPPGRERAMDEDQSATTPSSLATSSFKEDEHGSGSEGSPDMSTNDDPKEIPAVRAEQTLLKLENRPILNKTKVLMGVPYYGYLSPYDPSVNNRVTYPVLAERRSSGYTYQDRYASLPFLHFLTIPITLKGVELPAGYLSDYSKGLLMWAYLLGFITWDALSRKYPNHF